MATATARIIPFPQQQAREYPRPEAVQQRREGEETLCRYVLSHFQDAQTQRDRLVKPRTWQVWEDGYHGDYWPEILPSWKSPINVNEMKRLILQELSDLTDNTPTVYISNSLKAGERDRQAEQAMQAYWHREFIDLKVLEACVDAAVWPCGFLEHAWDPLKGQGQGDLDVRVRHPVTVYPDPYATSDEDWRYVILTDVMDVYEVRQKWPDQGWRARPDTQRPGDGSPLTGPGLMPGRGTGVLTPLYPIAAPIPSRGMDHRTTVYSMYVKDSSLDVTPRVWKDALGIEHLQRVSRLRYPHGRLIQCTQDVVLYDGPSPYAGGFPLTRIILQPTLHRFWPAKSLVGDLLELQRASDKLESLTVENALRMQKAVIVADSSSGIRQQSFGDIPGQIVYITPGSNVRWERPPALPPDLIQHGQRFRDIMGRQMGHTQARTGGPSRGNVSAELQETEISAAQGLTRLRARFLHASMQRFTVKLFAGMAQFYTAPRLLPLVLHEQWTPIVWQPVVDREKYAVLVDPNSFMIQSKTLIKRLALALAKLQKIDDETLLKTLDFPNAKEIADKTHQQLLLQAQARQQQRGQRKR